MFACNSKYFISTLDMMKHFWKLVIAVGICELVGILSTPFTVAAIPTWYASLTKPFFSPPNYVFGPVWAMLYALMGVSAYLIWKKGLKKKVVRHAMLYFVIQLVFNFIWSILFFGLHSPLLGLIDILALWISLSITMMTFYKISKAASYLLIPYLLWVSFATILNAAIAILNH